MIREGGLREDVPDLDLLCILEDFVEGESFVVGAAFFSVEEAIADSAEDGYLNIQCLRGAQKNNDKMQISERQRQDDDRKPRCGVLLGGNGREDWPAVFARLWGIVDEVKGQQRGQRSALKKVTATLAEDGVYERVQRSSRSWRELYLDRGGGKSMQVG